MIVLFCLFVCFQALYTSYVSLIIALERIDLLFSQQTCWHMPARQNTQFANQEKLWLVFIVPYDSGPMIPIIQIFVRICVIDWYGNNVYLQN